MLAERQRPVGMRLAHHRVDHVGMNHIVREIHVVGRELEHCRPRLRRAGPRALAGQPVDDPLPSRIRHDLERVVEAELLERPPRPADVVGLGQPDGVAEPAVRILAALAEPDRPSRGRCAI